VVVVEWWWWWWLVVVVSGHGIGGSEAFNSAVVTAAFKKIQMG
jgi:hypothetical protein